MFRALADQLEGDEEEHVKYRSMAVQYILVLESDNFLGKKKFCTENQLVSVLMSW